MGIRSKMEAKLSQQAKALAFQELKKQQERAHIEQRRILSKNRIAYDEDKDLEDMFDMFDWSMSSNLTYNMASDIEPDMETKISERTQSIPTYNSLNSSIRSNTSRSIRSSSIRSIRSSDRVHTLFQWGSNSLNLDESGSFVDVASREPSSEDALQLTFR